MGKGQTFVERRLRAIVTLSPDSTYSFYSDGKTKATTKTRSFSLPMRVDIQAPGLPSMDTATIRIYGMSEDDMSALSYLNYIDTYAINLSSITIVNEENEDLIFVGNIRSALPNYSEAPNVFIDIYAFSGLFAANAVLSPYSVSGTVPVSDLIKDVIDQYNTEVSGKSEIPQFSLVNLVGETKEAVDCPYLSGSLISKINQLNSIISNTRLQITLGQNNTVYFSTRSFVYVNEKRPIWFLRSFYPAGWEDRELETPDFENPENVTVTERFENPDSPIIGYPKFEEYGVSIQCLFLSGLLAGDLVNVFSLIPRVSIDTTDGANYRVLTFSHSLSSRIPGDGAWFTTLKLLPILPIKANEE